MRVLLTGGSGMVGHNVLATPAPGIEWLAPRRGELDLLRFDDVVAYMRRARPDAVVHAAGRVGGIQANLADPAGFFLENLELGRNVVWGAYKAGVRRLVNLSSSCVYPREAPNPLREESILDGALEPSNEGYALAKIATMKLCEYIATADSSFAYKTLVPCNLYGPHDHFDPQTSHLVASIVRKVHEAKENGAGSVEVWGDGTARREFMYVGDLAACVVRALQEYETIPSVMNVGTGLDHTVDEYYSSVADTLGWRGRFVHDTSKPVGMRRKVVDISRMRAWGWTPRTTLRDGLSRTYDHYRSMVTAARNAA